MILVILWEDVAMVETEVKNMKKSKANVVPEPEHIVALAHRMMRDPGEFSAGFPVNHLQTDAHHVFGNNWRVNVWVTLDENRLVPTHRIEHSFFLSYSPELDTISVR